MWPHQICSGLGVELYFSWFFFLNLPWRANAVAGHLTIVTQQLMIALHNAPGRNADADHTSCSLLPLQQQSVAHLLSDAWKTMKKETEKEKEHLRTFRIEYN